MKHAKETRRARVLDDKHVQRVLAYIEKHSRAPRSDEVKFLLSVSWKGNPT